jgi:protein gp37
MGDTSIEWTDKVWNPVRGCSRVSRGCEKCYAEKMAARFSDPGMAYEGLATRNPSRWTGEVRLVEEHLADPLKWRKPRRVFVNSMSDLFHERLEDHEIARVFVVMALARQHTFQVLTKRPERMMQWMKNENGERCTLLGALGTDEDVKATDPLAGWPWPLPNVHLGVSVEDQKTFEERWKYLRQTPAAVRFLSMEPLLGAIDMQSELWKDLREFVWPDWVIVGGESGPGARPCDIHNVRSIVEQCKSAGVACFVKQLGSVPVWDGCGLVANNPECLTSQSMDGSGLIQLHPSDRKGGDINEFPEDLRVRQFPASND